VFARFVNQLTILPRWVIIVIDALVLAVSTTLAYLLRFNFNIEEIEKFKPVTGGLIIVCCGLAAIIITRSYAGIVRYTGVEDGLRIMFVSVLSLVLGILLNLAYYYVNDANIIPYSVLFIAFFISFLSLFYYRLIVKTIFSYFKGEAAHRSNVVIFGAGSLGLITRTVIETDPYSKYRLVAFLEDDVNKRDKVINGIRIYGWNQADEIISRYNVKELIIAVKDLNNARKNEIVEFCLSRQLSVRIAPAPEKWVKGEFRLQQLKKVNIEDLLGRDVIRIDEEPLLQSFRNRRILVTGAAGSIGSELARQLACLHPQMLILVDQAETPLYELQQDLLSLKPALNFRCFVADITNRSRMENLFRETRPELVFHAAAYKHVPVMEANPAEAILTNVFGTRILADLATAFQVEKFVMVSTDKAVNPSSVMGCSKRIAEIYVQALSAHLARQGPVYTQFITTRFGNVLGSNGSVIPIFRRQIEEGGPVTVTHPEITRYFMTIPEACRLVLEAGAMGRGGEIFIFDMGNPIRIADLAKKMIRLSGFEPGKDIDIVYTGLREGEKLHEELLRDEEDTLPTHHPKILKARVKEADYHHVVSLIELFNDLLFDRNELKILALMKEIVPEFAYKTAPARNREEADYLRL